MKSFKALAFGVTFGVAMLLGTVSTASADVRVAIANGRVTVIAKDATLRQILAEWARVGQVKIVNLERVPGGPITLELPDMPEAQALDILLRSITGYIAAPREVAATNTSQFDRIVVMPTLATPRPAASAVAQQPTFLQPTPVAGPPDDDVDDERPAPPVGAAGAMPPRGPVFNPFPQPQVVNPQQPPNGYPQMPVGMGQPPAPQPANTTAPGAPAGGGVAVPGMIVAPPPQPGQIVQPPPPAKRPGGGPGGL
ncbi:MAG TPA: hypothetical protein VGJ29_04200 [Vicinamibacterales bacterium]